MMVDDEPVMLEIVQVLLEEEGYRHFVSVDDSTRAIDQLVKSNPDILLLDLDMPEVDGFEVLERVRRLDDYQYLPVIILTASENPANKLSALELGATDFLSKPVDPSELALRIRNTLAAKAYQDQLTYYDNLTGLPNRKLFTSHLGKGIAQARKDNRNLVLLEIGLDYFQNINETLGVHGGDRILRSVAERLLNVIRGNDIVGRSSASLPIENTARTGGDEFSVALYGNDSVENASVICNRLLAAIRNPFDIDGENVHLTASIGIAVYPDDGEEADALIKHAASAQDFAKKQGRDRFQFYSSEMEAHSRALIRMMADLKTALQEEQFEIHYQPQIDIASGAITGMESLIRWIHPQDGLIPPLKFIPVAEEIGLISEIGDWVLHEACCRASEWNATSHTDLRVSVNVSARQFNDSTFKASVESALRSSGLDPRNLVLEITESMLVGDTDQLAILLHNIRELGVSFSLDDFGTGYSSLSYLKKFPIDELKIDRSFMLGVPANPDDNSLVRAIIAMAHGLGQQVVAEGVEDAAQLEFLRQHGCNTVQGYYYSKPLCASDFGDYLSAQFEPPRHRQSGT